MDYAVSPTSIINFFSQIVLRTTGRIDLANPIDMYALTLLFYWLACSTICGIFLLFLHYSVKRLTLSKVNCK